MAKQIFISYRRKDAALQARLLKMYLAQCGYTVFMDQDDLDRTKPFPEELKRRVRECKDFLLVLTDDVVNFRNDGTDFLWEEALTAYEALQAAQKSGKDTIRLHTVSDGTFKKFDQFDSSWGNGKYHDAIEYFRKLTPSRLLKFEGRDESIVANLNAEIQDFLSKTVDNQLGTLSEKVQSLYEVDEKEEKRLLKQAWISVESDKPELAKIIERLRGGSDRKLTVLDVGCANGETGKIYFADDSVFGKVVGIDRDQALINSAWESDHPSRFTYKTLDVCADDFEAGIAKAQEKAGIDDFDIIFCCQVLHHVANRNQVISKLIDHLKEGGCLIIRGSDDGSKIIYQSGRDEENKNLLNEIMALTNTLPTMADRYYGRKICFDLEYAGLTDIRVIPQTISSSMIEEEKRRAFCIDAYNLSFSWRQYIFEPLPGDSEEKREELAALTAEMNAKLEKIKKMLYTNGCWYSDTEFFGYGFKRS